MNCKMRQYIDKSSNNDETFMVRLKYDIMTSVDKDKQISLVLSELSFVFYIVDRNEFISRLKTYLLSQVDT